MTTPAITVGTHYHTEGYPAIFPHLTEYLESIGYEVLWEHYSGPSYTRWSKPGNTDFLQFQWQTKDLELYSVHAVEKGTIKLDGHTTEANLNLVKEFLGNPTKLDVVEEATPYCEWGQYTKKEKEDEFGVTCKSKGTVVVKYWRAKYALCPKHLKVLEVQVSSLGKL